MKTPPNRDKKPIPLQEVEAALHAALRDEGRLFPKTEEDIIGLEEALDLSKIPSPDVNRFLSKLRQHSKSTDHSPSAKTKAKAAEILADLENLAAAARNGGAISEASRKKMDAARAKREKQRPN